MALRQQLFFSLGNVLDNVRLNPVISALALIAAAICLLLIGACVVLTRGAVQALPVWLMDSKVVAYLDAGISAQDQDALVEELKRWAEVEDIQSVSREDARKRLERQLGEWKSILEGIRDEDLPPSIEITVSSKAMNQNGGLEVFHERLRQSAHVQEVFSGKQSSERLYSILDYMKPVVLWGMAFIGLVAILIVSGTTRLTATARQDELDIYDLVGAAPFWTRLPYYIEAVLRGILASALAGIVLISSLSTLKGILTTPFVFVFSWSLVELFLLIFGLACCGTVLGWIGCWVGLKESWRI